MIIEYITVVLLWIVAVAFMASDVLCMLALFHHRKDREFVLIFAVVVVMFALFGAGAAYAAIAVGRCL